MENHFDYDAQYTVCFDGRYVFWDDENKRFLKPGEIMSGRELYHKIFRLVDNYACLMAILTNEKIFKKLTPLPQLGWSSEKAKEILENVKAQELRQKEFEKAAFRLSQEIPKWRREREEEKGGKKGYAKKKVCVFSFPTKFLSNGLHSNIGVFAVGEFQIRADAETTTYEFYINE